MPSTNGSKIQSADTRKQPETGRGDTRWNVRILTDAELAAATEHSLLELALAIYGFSHPELKQHAAFADMAGISRTTLNKALSGETHIGGEAWRRIERTLNMEVYQKWLRTK